MVASGCRRVTWSELADLSKLLDGVEGRCTASQVFMSNGIWLGQAKHGNARFTRFRDEAVYREPYSLVSNNCIHKSIRIARKARKLGKGARLIVCWSIVPMKILRGFPTIQPHMYVEVEGERVDVSLDPHHEEKYCKNSQKIIVLPVELPKLCWQRKI